MDAKTITCIYNANETMRLIGYQVVPELFDAKVGKQINEVMDARKFEITLDAALDVFVLGYIYGKRGKRARRKGGAAV